MMALMLAPIEPVLAPLTATLRRQWHQLCLAMLRRALRERVGPMHPDRVKVERRIIHHERQLVSIKKGTPS